jgi:hypothetical protein
MPTSTSSAIFISYAHKDNESSDPAKRWLDRLREHLEPLVQQGEIAVCSDQDIELGDDWHAHIQQHLDGAQAAVLMVSPAFLASKYIRNSELPVLFRNAKDQGVKIIPIILRPCLFAESRFKYPDPQTGPEEFTLASLQAAGSPKKALSEMNEGEQDRALLKVAQTLAQLATLSPSSPSKSANATPIETPPTRVAEAPGHLQCCFLIKEALASAVAAASGGGPSTRLHRQLDLASRWMKAGSALLPKHRAALDPTLAETLKWLCTDTLPLLIAEARRELPVPGDGDSKRGDNEIFKKVRGYASQANYDVSQTLNTDAAFDALAKSEQRWLILGFTDEAAYKDFLLPTVQMLARNPDPMQQDLFARLIAQPEFSPRQLHDEGYRQDIVMDTVNALMTVNWAKWTDLNEPGSKAKGTMTPVGIRLLKQLLGSSLPSTSGQGASAESRGGTVSQNEAAAIWREKLAYLRREEAIASDPAQRFTLKQQIAEAEAKIRELE